MKIKSLVLAALALAGAAQGAVTLQFSTTTTYVGGFQNGAGSINGTAARMVWGVIVSGTNGVFEGASTTAPYLNGFSLAATTTGISLSLLGGGATDDRLYIASAVMASNTAATDGSAIGDNRILSFAGLTFGGTGDGLANGGDKFAVVWFDVTSLGGTSAEGLKYGILENAGFVLPNDGATSPFGAPFAGADPSKPLTYTLGVAVPEPSTALLGLLGVAGLIRRRR